ncbi:MAG: hypothetical protein M3145_10065 [Pseudomonadota bacterium]|nr:hypothetical protein [Pseudomonadota bacterium]
MATDNEHGEGRPGTPLDPGPSIQDFPEAVRVVKLDTPYARQLAALRSHEADLAFCADALRLLRYLGETEPGHRMLEEALWTAALVRYFRCFFGGPTRLWRLWHTSVLREPEALDAFDEFRAICSDLLNNDAKSIGRFATGMALDDSWEPLGVLPLEAGPQHGPEHHERFARLTQMTLFDVRDRIARLLQSVGEEVRELETKDWRKMSVVWRRPAGASRGAGQES